MARISLSDVLIYIKNIGLTPVKQGNKYSVLFNNGNNLEFLSGTLQENIASNFSINGRSVNKNINFDEILKVCLEKFENKKEKEKMSENNLNNSDISQAAVS